MKRSPTRLALTMILSLLVSLLAAQDSRQHLSRAVDLFEKQDFANALKEVNTALSTDSLSQECLLLKGNILWKLKDFEGAYNAYTALAALETNSVKGLNQRAVLLQNIGQPELAIADLDSALRIAKVDSFRLPTYINRGAAKVAIRDFSGAYSDFFQAYRIDSLDIGVLNNLAMVCDETGRGEETLVYLNRILKIDSTFVGAYENIGFKYSQMGEHKKAITYFDKALTIQPDEPLAYGNRAFSKYKLNDLQGAEADVNRSISIYPGNSYSYRTRALIYLAQKKGNLACQDLLKASQLGFLKMYGDEVETLRTKHCNGNMIKSL